MSHLCDQRRGRYDHQAEDITDDAVAEPVDVNELIVGGVSGDIDVWLRQLRTVS